MPLLFMLFSVASAGQGVFLDVFEAGNRKPGFARFLRETLQDRGVELHEIAVPLVNTPGARAELAAADEIGMRFAALPPASLDFIYIHTHGITENGRTHLSGLGSLYEDGWGTMLERTLAHLRGRFRPRAVVVVGSCWLFDGAGADGRAAVLARFLGLREGLILGVRNRCIVPSQVEVRSPYFDPSVGLHFLHQTVTTGHANVGKLYRFSGGRPVGMEDVRFDLRTIRRCVDELQTAPPVP